MKYIYKLRLNNIYFMLIFKIHNIKNWVFLEHILSYKIIDNANKIN